MVQYNFLKSWLQAHTTSERGASLVEYALLVALIAVVCIAAIGVLSGGVQKTFSETGDSLSGV
ncbi:MAG: Flp family type IVb pilin [Microthrixaceae bacterium]